MDSYRLLLQTFHVFSVHLVSFVPPPAALFNVLFTTISLRVRHAVPPKVSFLFFT